MKTIKTLLEDDMDSWGCLGCRSTSWKVKNKTQ